MRKTLKRIGIGLVILAAACFVFDYFFPYFFDIDTCLDRGGAWNYDINQCRFK